jgi:hypothetical protein
MQPFNSQVIVDLSFELYSVLVNLSYIAATTISLPPHAIPERAIQRFAPEMDPVVVDLIQRLSLSQGLVRSYNCSRAKSKNLIRELGFAQNPMELEREAAEEAGDYIEKWSVC